MSSYEMFIFLCNEAYIQPSTIAQTFGLSRYNLRMWKKGSFIPQSNTIVKIAEFFGVSMDFMNEKTGIHHCAGCGMEYDRFQEDLLHTERHGKWLIAVSKFDFCWNEHQRAKSSELEKIVMDENKPFKERYFSYVEIMMACFSHSLEISNYNVSHPDFKQYASFYLYNKPVNCPQDVYEALVSRYGAQEGMKGTCYPIAKAE